MERGRGGDTLIPPPPFLHQHHFLSLSKKEQDTKNVIREATMKSWETAKQLSYELGTPAKSKPFVAKQTAK